MSSLRTSPTMSATTTNPTNSHTSRCRMLPNTLSAAWPDSQPMPPTTQAHSTAPIALSATKRVPGTADMPMKIGPAMRSP